MATYIPGPMFPQSFVDGSDPSVKIIYNSVIRELSHVRNLSTLLILILFIYLLRINVHFQVLITINVSCRDFGTCLKPKKNLQKGKKV